MRERETIKVEEVAKRLNRSLEAIKCWIRSGECPFASTIRMDSGQCSYIIPRLAFENWMAQGNAKIVQQVVIGREEFDTFARAIIAR